MASFFNPMSIPIFYVFTSPLCSVKRNGKKKCGPRITHDILWLLICKIAKSGVKQIHLRIKGKSSIWQHINARLILYQNIGFHCSINLGWDSKIAIVVRTQSHERPSLGFLSDTQPFRLVSHPA